ncbi:hypothetical protein [Marivirga harenae]|uniref:hypothetical protein n=1 Tax=Marivirga harenae TaxID=2010992 RepID=UPI0026DF237A|nr:hypothetical protein [Marivirga harenae]WKV12428.1 hypothetical protein Q3Y49_01085 [Marivirga harenae]
MDMKSEDRINRALKSVENIERAKAPEDGFQKIQAKIAAQKNVSKNTKGGLGTSMLKMAAMIAIILSFNIWAASNYLGKDNVHLDNSAYSQITTDYNLYENEQ